jgi:hypothetical protein
MDMLVLDLVILVNLLVDDIFHRVVVIAIVFIIGVVSSEINLRRFLHRHVCCRSSAVANHQWW